MYNRRSHGMTNRRFGIPARTDFPSCSHLHSLLSLFSFLLFRSGSRLLSHTVSSIVSSAAQGLTCPHKCGLRVRDGYGCFPWAHRHRKFSVIIHRSLRLLTTGQQSNPYFFLRKEVIQPHLPIRLPCYDFTPVTGPAFGGSFLSVRSPTSGISDSHGVTGGVYKTRERIHRSILICDY